MSKKINLLLSNLLVAFLFFMNPHAFAATPTSACSGEDGDVPIYCAYITLNDSSGQGRYVKIVVDDLYSVTGCAKDSDAYQTYVEDVPYYDAKPGAHYLQFYICPDASGNNCTFVNRSDFTILQSGNTYIAQPRYHEVNLTPFQNRFTGCVQPQYDEYRNRDSKSKQARHTNFKHKLPAPEKK